MSVVMIIVMLVNVRLVSVIMGSIVSIDGNCV